jgi:GNAT superfamily N-acetyltransferase
MDCRHHGHDWRRQIGVVARRAGAHLSGPIPQSFRRRSWRIEKPRVFLTETSMLTIRFAVLDDVPLLRNMIYEFAEFEHLSASITGETLARDGFGATPRFRVLLAEWDGQPAGYAFFFDYYSSFDGRMIFLEDIFVRSQFRGKGFGRALFARISAIALENDCHAVMFNVLDWNQAAIDFYRILGAEFWNEWKMVCLRGSALQAIAGEVH